jgi:PEP-CTERM motif
MFTHFSKLGMIMPINRKSILAAAALSAAFFATPASATLNLFQSWTGSYGLSTDGGGDASASSYSVSAFVPVGATVTAAYLYQSTYNFSAPAIDTISLNGNALTFSPAVTNATACCNLTSARADVTSLVASIVNGGPGGTYNFTVAEGNTGNTDGTALVVVYQLASLAESTVAILDGFASVTGDTATFNFATPLNPLAPGFVADMRLGIGFSCCGQKSTVSVNGTTITENAGQNDDSSGPSSLFNGQLITVGGDDDPYSTLLPGYDDDHERYNLTPYINVGDTAINVTTANASADDNIFLAAFRVTGKASVVTPGVPEPTTWGMMVLGFGIVGGAMRSRRRRNAIAIV